MARRTMACKRGMERNSTSGVLQLTKVKRRAQGSGFIRALLALLAIFGAISPTLAGAFCGNVRAASECGASRALTLNSQALIGSAKEACTEMASTASEREHGSCRSSCCCGFSACSSADEEPATLYLQPGIDLSLPPAAGPARYLGLFKSRCSLPLLSVFVPPDGTRRSDLGRAPPSS